MPTKQKNGLYRARVKIGVDSNGKDIYKYFSGRTKKELEQNRQTVINVYITGAALNDDRLFGDYAKEWFDMRLPKKLSVSTRNSYRNVLNSQILPEFGDRNLRSIQPLEIQNFVDRFAGMSASTITYVHAAFRKIYKCALADRIVDRDPSEHVAKPEATPAEEKRALTPEERKAVETVCRTSPHGLYLALLYYLGVRSGEAAGFRWEDVDWNKRVIKVRRDIDYKAGGVPGDLKTKKSRRDVPIPAPLFELLKENRSLPATYIVHGDMPANPMRKCQATAAWKSLMADCGIVRPSDEKGKHGKLVPAISPHYMRHNYITMCWESGIDAYTTSRMVGHSNITTTLKIYTHLTEKQQKTAAQKLDAMFSSASELAQNPFESSAQ